MTNLSADIYEILNSKPVLDFLESAKRFIDIMENDSSTGDQFYCQSHLALIELYSTGMMLPEISLIYSNEDSNFDDKYILKSDFYSIGKKLGKWAFYQQSFDPIYPTDDEPTQGWLVDDYIAIYTDLKTELYKIELMTNEAVEDALWKIRSN